MNVFPGLARVLLAADGLTDAAEPPIVTAVTYGKVDMSRAPIAAGADLEATGFASPEEPPRVGNVSRA